MEYAIFPMEEINISQRHNGRTSHRWDETGVGCKAIDLEGIKTSASGVCEDVFAPTTMKVLWIHPRANTVAFGTCDKHGNPAPVKCEDGKERILTFAFVHINDDDLADLGIEKGRIYPTGTVCYREGGKAEKENNKIPKHVHIEVAEGWIEKDSDREISSPGGKEIVRFKNNVSLFPHQIFFKLEVHTKAGKEVMFQDGLLVGNKVGTRSGLNGYTMKEVPFRQEYVVPNMGVKDNLKGLYIRASKMSFNIRESANTRSRILKNIPMGQCAIIWELLGIQSDGYQWCKVEHYGVVGYVQMDLRNCYTLFTEGKVSRNMHLHATRMAFRIRQNPNTRSRILKTIERGEKAIIWEFLGIQSDGYQWCKVEHYGIVGYAQMDLRNCYTISE